MDKQKLEEFRVAPGLDLFVVPRFAQDVLGVADPKALLGELEAYPSVGADESITPGIVQWVTGDNRALKYRGNVLKRGKIWLQKTDPAQHGFLRYGYTGWQWRVLPATADVARCKEVEPIADKYDAWAAKLGAKPANHYIVTKYKDGAHNIGFHTDKPQDIAASDADGVSLITVVKIGACARPFAVREVAPKGEKERAPFFCKALEPGTAVIMSLEANLLTQHAVPPVEESGPSGSIVFRSIATRIDAATAAREIRRRE